MAAAAARLVVTGTVQGVGFRYRAARLAQQHHLTGLIRNLPDGRVEILAEGPAPALAAYTTALRALPPPIRVDRVDATPHRATGRYPTLRIRTGRLSDELIEGFATGAVLLDHVAGKLDHSTATLGAKLDHSTTTLAEKIDHGTMTLGEKIDHSTATLGAKLDELHTDFQTLNARYGGISDELKAVRTTLETVARAVEALAAALRRP